MLWKQYEGQRISGFVNNTKLLHMVLKEYRSCAANGIWWTIITRRHHKKSKAKEKGKDNTWGMLHRTVQKLKVHLQWRMVHPQMLQCGYAAACGHIETWGDDNQQTAASWWFLLQKQEGSGSRHLSIPEA